MGRLLREHLDPGGHEEFVARVLAARRPAPVWEVLARWTRIGIAAAALIGGMVALGSRSANRAEGESLSLADAMAPASMLSAESAPVPGGTFNSLLEER